MTTTTAVPLGRATLLLLCLALLAGGAEAGTRALSPKLGHPAGLPGSAEAGAGGRRECAEQVAGGGDGGVGRRSHHRHLAVPEQADVELVSACRRLDPAGGRGGRGVVGGKAERLYEDNWMESDSDSEGADGGGGEGGDVGVHGLVLRPEFDHFASPSPLKGGRKAGFSNGWDGLLKGESVLGSGPHQGFDSAWACLPHPVKAYRGGEDVRMSINVGKVSLIGVFDGVGGWADMGVDPAMYARSMALIIARELKRNPTISEVEDRPLVTLLDAAHRELEDMQLPGSCTACLGMLTGDGRLHVLNLGDSGIQLVRDGTSVFATNEQQHYFNCPFQLGMGSADKPTEADYYVLEDVAPGDIVVAATDGVWDNMYEEDIVRVIREYQGDPRLVADEIASISQRHGANPSYYSPFWRSAAAQGLEYHGGKLDDVTVVVARVGVGEDGGRWANKGTAQQQWVDHYSPVSSDGVEGEEEEGAVDGEEDSRYLARGEGEVEIWGQEVAGGGAVGAVDFAGWEDVGDL